MAIIYHKRNPGTKVVLDLIHASRCKALHLSEPQLRDCTCGVVIDALVAERNDLQAKLDGIRRGLGSLINEEGT